MERITAAEKAKRVLHRHWPVLLVLVVLLMAGSVSGVLFAKYITTNRQHVAMVSAGFHMSSNLLETKAVTNIGATDQVVIELYNFEKENNAQVSAVDISYTITVTNGRVRAVTNGAVTVPSVETDGVKQYTLSAGPEKVTHTIRIAPDHAGPVTVTVTSVAPFKKSLSGSFSFTDPVYKLENVEGELYKLTVYTNGYNGGIQFSLGSGVFADRTVDLQQGWTGSSNTLMVHDNETYELRFFGDIRTTSSPVTLTGAAKTIQIGN